MKKPFNLKNLIQSMTIEEKVGQLHQVPPFFFGSDKVNEVAGPLRQYQVTEEQVYKVGSILGTANPKEMVALQKQYLEKSRLKIPLMFMADIIHGYKTIFPIPLALAASFNPRIAKLAARISAVEATTSGISVTFSPMADLARDARWGRVMESSGENPYLNYQMTKAMVEGYQGDALSDPTTLAACGKHVAAYGAAVSGKDYTQAELSKHTLYQYYLEGYRACVDANAALMMSAFNVVEGIPSTINKDVLITMLRKHLGFKGVLISDYDSLKEAVAHRTVANEKEAAQLGIEAMLDIEMTSGSYQKFLPALIKEGKVSESLLDKAVYRVLKLKKDLGLFDDPYRGIDEEKEASLPLSKDHYQAALEASYEGIVLLKNDRQALPLKSLDGVVFIGSLLQENNLLGAWAWHGEIEKTPSLASILMKHSHLAILPTDDIKSLTDEQLVLLKDAKKVVVIIGERSKEFGEARSKVNPTLDHQYRSLVHDVASLNPHVQTVIFAGRPLVISEIVDHSESILYSFYLGSAMADAVLDTLLGKNNPSARLPMTLPSHVGQLPIYADILPTGRPFEGKPYTYTSHFIDGGNTPLYPFGYGLSYSQFTLEQVKLFHQSEQEIVFDMVIKNTSEALGKTVAFVYVVPPIVGIALPSKILCAFEKVTLEGHTASKVMITVDRKHLQYYTSDLTRKPFTGSMTFLLTLDGITFSEHHVVVS